MAHPSNHITFNVLLDDIMINKVVDFGLLKFIIGGDTDKVGKGHVSPQGEESFCFMVIVKTHSKHDPFDSFLLSYLLTF